MVAIFISVMIFMALMALPFVGIIIFISVVRERSTTENWEGRKESYFDNKFNGKKAITMNFSKLSARPSAQEAVEESAKRGYRVDSTVPVGGSTTLVFKKL